MIVFAVLGVLALLWSLIWYVRIRGDRCLPNPESWTGEKRRGGQIPPKRPPPRTPRAADCVGAGAVAQPSPVPMPTPAPIAAPAPRIVAQGVTEFVPAQQDHPLS